MNPFSWALESSWLVGVNSEGKGKMRRCKKTELKYEIIRKKYKI